MNLNAMKNIVHRSPAPAARAFTLIELLVVISIIGVLAAFTVTTIGVVTRNKYISAARSDMASIQTALERYKAQYGFYPPSNPTNLLVNPLFFELEGVTNVTVGGAASFVTLDGMNSVPVNTVSNLLGVAGFVNTSHGAGEDAVLAKNFLPDLKTKQVSTGYNNTALLVTSVGGPDNSYQPLGVLNCNPWRYNSANPTNNPGSYDLYVQLVIGGKTNLICNWSKAVAINNPLK